MLCGFFCDCGTVMDRVCEFPGPPRPSTVSQNRANLGRILISAQKLLF